MRRHCAFAGFLTLSAVIWFRSLAALIGYSLGHESASHILLIPFVTIYLLITERENIFRSVETSLGIGSALFSVGVLFCFLSFRLWSSAEGNIYLSGTTLGLVIMWLGGFIGIYGIRAARQAAFPLLF